MNWIKLESPKIQFFVKTKQGIKIVNNWRFKITYARFNTKPLKKLHILIRNPLFVLERNNGFVEFGFNVSGKHYFKFY